MYYSIMLQATAIEQLQKIFSNTTSDVVTLSEAYKAAKFNLNEEKKNRAWIGNKLTSWKAYGFAEPLYATTENNNKILIKIKLTEEGKYVLGRGATVVESQNNKFVANQSHIMAVPQQSNIVQLLSDLSRANPGSKITYNLKDEVISIQQVEA